MRKNTKICEEVVIPPNTPAPPSEGETLIPIASLDEVSVACEHGPIERKDSTKYTSFHKLTLVQGMNSKVACAQVIKTLVTNDSPSQNCIHPDDPSPSSRERYSWIQLFSISTQGENVMNCAMPGSLIRRFKTTIQMNCDRS